MIYIYAISYSPIDGVKKTVIENKNKTINNGLTVNLDGNSYVNEISSFSSAIVDFRKNPKEYFSTIDSVLDPSYKGKIHKLETILTQFALSSSSSCQFSFSPDEDIVKNLYKTSSISTIDGDIVEVFFVDDILSIHIPIFLGVVENISIQITPQGKFFSISLGSFLEEMSRKNMQAVMENFDIPVASETMAPYQPDVVQTDKNVPAKEFQTNFQRYCSSLVENLIRIGNYTQYVPIFHDLDKIEYFSIFDISSSQLVILQRLMSLFQRDMFSRKNGSIYAVQFYNEKCFDMFNVIDFQELLDNCIGFSQNNNFYQVSYNCKSSYINSPIFTSDFVVAEYEMKNVPNESSVFKSTDAIVLQVPSDSTITETIAWLNYIKSVTSPIITLKTNVLYPSATDLFDINKILKKKDIDAEKTLLGNFATMQLIDHAYSSLANSQSINITLPLMKDFIKIDIGDYCNVTLNSTQVMHIVTSVSLSFSTSATIALQLTPLYNISPALLLTTST